MQKMGLLRNVLKSGHLIRVGHQNPRISSLLRESPRAFSTAGGTTTQDSPSLVDPVLNNPTTGLTCYGTVIGITRHTTKDDILNLLEDCNLTPEDLKVRYTPFFAPFGMLIQFPSMKAYDTALKTLGRKARGYRLISTRHDIWPRLSSYDGKALLLQDIPRNAVQDDIDRLLSGCPQDGTSFQAFTRVIDNVPIRMAIVQFPSAILARLAFLSTMRKFCLNNQVSAQVLY